MDYQRALDALRRQLEQTPDLGDFLPLEARLLDNLRREARYGSTDTLRHERSEIVDRLNGLARSNLEITFNDLLFGRMEKTGLADPRLTTVRESVPAVPTPNSISPPVETKLQLLPFNELTWEQFELLCAALVQAQPQVIDCHLYGVRGDDQKGIDIIAVYDREKGQETWVYQCKRYQSYSERLLREALNEIEYKADVFVLFLSIEAGAKLRDAASKNPNTFLWDARDLSRKLKNYPQLIEDFFGPAWRKAFVG